MAQKTHLYSTLSLFSSFSTLFCCALPALMVSLGAGAALIGLVNSFPELIWLSQHKAGLFIFSGGMITVSAISVYRNKNAPCPVDAGKARSCIQLRRFSKIMLYVSACIYSIGFYFAFIAPYFNR